MTEERRIDPPRPESRPFVQSPALWLAGLTVAWIQLWWWTRDGTRPAHFFEEGGAIDAWSTTCFLAGSALAWAGAVAGRSRGARDAWFWWMSAIGLLFLALDDRYQIHERMGYGFLTSRLGTPPPWLRNWNDLILIVYGAAGFVVLVSCRHVLLRCRRMRNLLVLAFILFALHTAIDSIVVAEGPSKTMWEESFKALAAASIASAFLYGLVDRIALPPGIGPRPALPGPALPIGPGLLVVGLVAAIAAAPSSWVDALRHGWGPPTAWFALTALGCSALFLGAGLLLRDRPARERASEALLVLSLVVLAYGEMTYACGSRFVHAALAGWIHPTRGPDAAWLHSEIHTGTILTLAVVALGAQWTARQTPVLAAARLLHVLTALAALIVIERLVRPADLPRAVRSSLHVGLGLSAALASLVLLVSRLDAESRPGIPTDDPD